MITLSKCNEYISCFKERKLHSSTKGTTEKNIKKKFNEKSIDAVTHYIKKEGLEKSKSHLFPLPFIESDFTIKSKETRNKEGQLVLKNDGECVLLCGLTDPRFALKILRSITKDSISISKDRILENEQLTFLTKHPTSKNSVRQITVSINEIEQRFLISKKKIVSYINKGLLKNLLIEKSHKLQSLPYIVNNFNEIWLKLKKNEGGLQQQDKINRSQLMKIIRRCFRLNFISKIDQPEHLLNSGKTQLLVFTEKHPELSKMQVLAKIDGGKVRLARVDTSVVLGKGTFGIAHKVAHLDQAKYSVLKVAFTDIPAKEQALEEVKNERFIQKTIWEGHKIDDLEGVQEPPAFEVDILENPPLIGYLGPLYEGDLLNFILTHKVSPPIALDICTQILNGAEILTKKGIIHCDNKPDNILIRRVFEKGILKKVVAHIADFGGARLQGKITSPVSKITFSNTYMPIRDLYAIMEMIRANDLENYIKRLRSLEVYQRGTILYTILAGKLPYHLSPEGYADSNKKRFSERICNGRITYNTKITKQIASMLDPDFNNRPSAIEAAKKWRETISLDCTLIRGQSPDS